MKPHYRLHYLKRGELTGWWLEGPECLLPDLGFIYFSARAAIVYRRGVQVTIGNLAQKKSFIFRSKWDD